MGKVLKRSFKVIGYIVGGLVLLLCLPFLALTFPRGRAAMLDVGLDQANEHLPIRVRIERLDRLDPFGVDLVGIYVTSPEGKELIDLRKLSVRLDPWAFTSSQVHLTYVGLSQGFADVDGLIQAFASDEPEPPPPETPSTLDIRLDRLEADNVRARAPVGDRVLDARIGAISAAGSYGVVTAVMLAKLDADVRDEQGELARFRTKSGDFDLDKGGRAEIEGQVINTKVQLKVSAGALPEAGLLPDARVFVKLTGVDEPTLKRLGVADFALAKPVDVQVSALAEDQRFHASVALFALAERIVQLDASGTLEDLKARVHIARTHLASLSSTLPDMTVGGQLEATLQGAFDDANVTAGWKDVKIDQQVVPDGRLAAKLGKTSVDLASLTLEDLAKALQVEGAYDWESGDARVKLDLARTELSSLSWLDAGGARGRVAANIDATLSGDGDLGGDVKLAVDGAAFGTTKLQKLTTKLDVGGSLDLPKAKGVLAMNGLSSGSVTVHDAALDLDLRGENGQANFHVNAPNANLKGLLYLKQADGARNLSINAKGIVYEQPLTGAVNATQAKDKALTAKLNLHVGEQKLGAEAHLSKDERLVADVQLSAIDLDCWANLIGEPELRGRLDAHATAHGAMAAPKVTLDAVASDVTSRGQPKTNIKVAASGDIGKREYAANLAVRGSEDSLAVDLASSIVLPKRAVDTLDWLEGPYEIHSRMHLPAERLAMFDPKRLAPLNGKADIVIDVKGGDRKVDAFLTVGTELLLAHGEDDRADTLQLTVKVTQEKASYAVLANDREGELIRSAGEVTWPKGTLFAAGDADAWKKPPDFRLGLTLSERRIDELQGVYAYLAGIYDLTMPIKVGAKLDLYGTGEDLGGALKGKAMVMADLIDPTCALGTQVASTFDVALDRGEVAAHVVAKDMHGGTVDVRANQKLNIDPSKPAGEWLDAATLAARGQNLTLRTLPGMCGLSDGKAAFQASAKAFDGKPARANLDLGVENLRGGRGEPVGLHVVAALTPEAIQAEGELAVQNAQRGSFTFHTPLPKNPPSDFPQLAPDAPIEATLALNKLPVSPFMSVGDTFGRPSGHISARMRVVGPMNKPRPEGHIELDDVSLTLASAAQPLKHVTGRLEIKDHEIILQKLTAGDLDGKVALKGRALIKDDLTGDARINLRADKLPLRRQGEVIGELTINADASAVIPANKKAEVTVKIKEGRIWLTGDQGRAVQSLDANPDVRFVDRAGEAEQKKKAAEEQPVDPEGKPQLGFAFMALKSERDMWVMHESFSVQVGLDLRFVQEAEPVLRGEIVLTRGDLTILGKVFTLQKGAIRFVGDSPPDPELDITAVHKLPNGKQLIVTVTGRGTTPILAFSGAANDAGEAVALLTGVGKSGAQSSAEEDAKNFAYNLTAGLLTVAARREFGDWVPVLGVENNEAGEVNGVRAGFDASDLIPKPLRGFARAAYVEGIVTGGGSSSGSSSATSGLGVKVEVVLPADLITSWGYGPGATWSTDIAWAP